MPENGTFFTKTLFLTDKHRTIMSLFDLSKDQFKFGWRIDEVRILWDVIMGLFQLTEMKIIAMVHLLEVLLQQQLDFYQ